MLLIEDDDDDAVIVADLLADEPVDVRLRRARTLRAGLELLGDGFDCVLLDLRLPDAAGMDALRHVREAAPLIAVIVLTGLDDETTGETAMQHGAQDYLIKGRVDGRLLARSIRYAVGRRHAEDVSHQLRVAELRADETARLERGLVPHPIVSDRSIWIASRYLPGRRRALIGGDFYDAVETADGCLHVVMGDVSGRGPDEAAVGAGLRIAWRSLILSGASGASGDRMLHTLQTMIEHERQGPRTFATLCTLELDPRRHELRLRRAGHPAPMLLDGAAARSLPLDHGGPPIGMFEHAQWPQARFTLPDEWSILLYTDGVIESRDGDSGHLGEEGLRRLIEERVRAQTDWRREPEELLRHLVDRTRALNGEDFSDDVALLLLGVRETAHS